MVVAALNNLRCITIKERERDPTMHTHNLTIAELVKLLAQCLELRH